MPRVKIQVTIDSDSFPALAAMASTASWADVTRDGLRLYDWAATQVFYGHTIRLVDSSGEESTVVIPGAMDAVPKGERPEEVPPAETTSLSVAAVPRAIEELVEEAKELLGQPGSGPPPLPDSLTSEADARAALRAAVWWAGRPGIPSVRLGRHRIQPARLNTAPIAVLSSILVARGASKAELESAAEYLLPVMGRRAPTTDAVGFWTSPRMQAKHGYRIEREGDQHRYIDEVPD